MFAKYRTADNPLLIGSIKTNLGHCEGASGLAGVIKAVLCLEHAYIPATIGIKKLNPDSMYYTLLQTDMGYVTNEHLLISKF